MIVKLKIEKEFDVEYLQVNAGVRYWEDATVNDEEDEAGDLIPCRVGDRWKPIININTGIIENWEKGKVAKIHYKICDDGIYYLLDKEKEIVIERDSYVIDSLAINDKGYGDYIIMNVNEDGLIEDWDASGLAEDFETEE